MAEPDPRSRTKKLFSLHAAAFSILSILAIGAALSWWAATGADGELRADLLRGAQALAQAMDIQGLKALTAPGAPEKKAEYRRLMSSLALARQVSPRCRFIYLVGKDAEGKSCVLLGSEGARAPELSPTGTAYAEQAFASRAASVVGPYTGTGGQRVTALFPLPDPLEGSPVAVLAMELDAGDWGRMIARRTLPTALLALALAAIAAMSLLLSRRGPREGGDARPGTRHMKIAAAISVGLVLTLFSAWTFHEREKKNREEAFWQLAMSRTEAVVDGFARLRDTEMESLASLYGDDEDASVAAFLSLSAYLTRNPAVQGWEWVAPIEGNRSALGYDLGSEPLRRAALEEAAVTGLATATDPIDLVQETGGQKGMLVFKPVYERAESKTLRGYAVAVLRIRSLLGEAAEDDSAFLRISLLREGASPVDVADTWERSRPPRSGLEPTRALFAFGKAFALTAFAGDAFMRIHPARAGGIALLTGLLFTALVAAALNGILRRRESLELLVAERTEELLRTTQSYQSQFANNSAAMILVDPADGAILDANASAVEFYGYPAETLLSMRIEVLHSIVNDVTERARAEAELRRATDRLLLATRAGGVGIWEYDAVTGVESWDEQMYRLYGVERSRFAEAAEAWRSAVHPEDLEREDEEIEQALRGERDFDTGFRVIWPDGSVRHIRAIASVRRDAAGAALHMTGTNWDISSQKRLEAELRESNRYLMEANAKAVEALRRIPYDLVLMDCQMPDMDGYEATGEIRKLGGPGSRIPVIAMTANALKRDRERCLAAGMDDYLSKPVEPRALDAILERWLRGSEELLEAEPAAGEGAEAGEPVTFDRIDFLDRVMGDEAIARDLIRKFIQDLPIQVEKLISAVSAGDAEASERQAHRIKGAAANMSCRALRATMEALRTAG